MSLGIQTSHLSATCLASCTTQQTPHTYNITLSYRCCGTFRVHMDKMREREAIASDHRAGVASRTGKKEITDSGAVLGDVQLTLAPSKDQQEGGAEGSQRSISTESALMSESLESNDGASFDTLPVVSEVHEHAEAPSEEPTAHVEWGWTTCMRGSAVCFFLSFLVGMLMPVRMKPTTGVVYSLLVSFTITATWYWMTRYACLSTSSCIVVRAALDLPHRNVSPPSTFFRCLVSLKQARLSGDVQPGRRSV